jgi:hypothetical protein
MSRPTPTDPRPVYDRQLLLGGAKRDTVLELWEVQRYGTDSYGDADYVSLYGMPPSDWYASGIRLLGRTAVECTRDGLGDAIGKDIAAVARTAPAMTGPRRPSTSSTPITYRGCPTRPYRRTSPSSPSSRPRGVMPSARSPASICGARRRAGREPWYSAWDARMDTLGRSRRSKAISELGEAVA